jgi:hypothetical protein
MRVVGGRKHMTLAPILVVFLPGGHFFSRRREQAVFLSKCTSGDSLWVNFYRYKYKLVVPSDNSHG